MLDLGVSGGPRPERFKLGDGLTNNQKIVLAPKPPHPSLCPHHARGLLAERISFAKGADGLALDRPGAP